MTDTVVAHKSTVRRWIEKIADATGQEVTKSHAQELAMTVRQMGEGGVVGAVLGAIDSEVGLDVKGVPVDLALSVMGGGAAMYFAREEYSHDLRNIGSHSLAIFSYRKTKQLLKTMSGAKVGLEDSDGRQPGDETSDVGEEDPVVQAAREL